jgi:hypothetical protein
MSCTGPVKSIRPPAVDEEVNIQLISLDVIVVSKLRLALDMVNGLQNGMPHLFPVEQRHIIRFMHDDEVISKTEQKYYLAALISLLVLLGISR